jgi:hypothetical protein
MPGLAVTGLFAIYIGYRVENDETFFFGFQLQQIDSRKSNFRIRTGIGKKK